MKIKEIVLTPYVVDKLIWKHHVSETEVRQVFRNRPKIRFWEKGHVSGENLYLALGQTDAGRYLAVYFTGISATHAYDRRYQCLADQRRENARINPRDVGARGADSGLGIESNPKQRHF